MVHEWQTPRSPGYRILDRIAQKGAVSDHGPFAIAGRVGIELRPSQWIFDS